MCVYMCARAHTNTQTHTHTHTHTHAHTYTHTHTHTYTHTHTHKFTHTHTHTNTHRYTHTHSYTCPTTLSEPCFVSCYPFFNPQLSFVMLPELLQRPILLLVLLLPSPASTIQRQNPTRNGCIRANLGTGVTCKASASMKAIGCIRMRVEHEVASGGIWKNLEASRSISPHLTVLRLLQAHGGN